jgi:hypothetical protein
LVQFPSRLLRQYFWDSIVLFCHGISSAAFWLQSHFVWSVPNTDYSLIHGIASVRRNSQSQRRSIPKWFFHLIHHIQPYVQGVCICGGYMFVCIFCLAGNRIPCDWTRNDPQRAGKRLANFLKPIWRCSGLQDWRQTETDRWTKNSFWISKQFSYKLSQHRCQHFGQAWWLRTASPRVQ